MRRLLSVLALAFVSLSFNPAQAGGLLQDLFAPAPRPSPIVHYYAPAQPQIRFLYDEGLRVSRRPAPRKAIARKAHSQKWVVGRKKSAPVAFAPASSSKFHQARRFQRAAALKSKARVAAVAPVPAKFAAAPVKPEAPAQIDNDPTLRIGDAYMTPEGLRIFRGAVAKAASSKNFVDFRRSTLGAGVKSQLAVLENAGRSEQARGLIAPALKVAPIGAGGRKSVDREGRVIRVVGP